MRIVWTGVRKCGPLRASTAHKGRRYTVLRSDDGNYAVRINALLGDTAIDLIGGWRTMRAAKTWCEDEIRRRQRSP